MKKTIINKTFLITSSLVFACLFSCTDQEKTTKPLQQTPEPQIEEHKCKPEETAANTQPTPLTVTEEALQNLSVTSIIIEAKKIEAPVQETAHLSQESISVEQSEMPETQKESVTVNSDVIKE